jgi:hypothetical protein
MKKLPNGKESLRRTHKKSLLLNDREKKVIDSYCRKYKISNQSKFMRETIITAILKQYDADYPSLFDNPPSLFTPQ